MGRASFHRTLAAASLCHMEEGGGGRVMTPAKPPACPPASGLKNLCPSQKFCAKRAGCSARAWRAGERTMTDPKYRRRS